MAHGAPGRGWSELAEELGERLASLDPPGKLLGVGIDASGLPRFRAKLPTAARAEGRALVRRYESRASELCEECGGAGRVRGGVVVTVLCDDCLPEAVREVFVGERALDRAAGGRDRRSARA